MSREIKFRAYTSEGMVTPYAWVNESNMFGQRMSPAPIKPLMQFTGLRDANGVEIYEGDIIRYVCKSKIETITRPVVFKYAEFMVEESTMCDVPLSGICSDENHNGFHVGFVIGNVFEHPHLIDEAK